MVGKMAWSEPFSITLWLLGHKMSSKYLKNCNLQFDHENTKWTDGPTSLDLCRKLY